MFRIYILLNRPSIGGQNISGAGRTGIGTMPGTFTSLLNAVQKDETVRDAGRNMLYDRGVRTRTRFQASGGDKMEDDRKHHARAGQLPSFLMRLFNSSVFTRGPDNQMITIEFPLFCYFF